MGDVPHPLSAATNENPKPKLRISPQQTQSQRVPPAFDRHSLDTRSQHAYLQAYIQAIRSGQIPMPGVSAQNLIAHAQKQANHNRTISDPKRGGTYAGQDQLKKLPIPPLEETCRRYLESVKPFLVIS
jgi:hypothetical protein